MQGPELVGPQFTTIQRGLHWSCEGDPKMLSVSPGRPPSYGLPAKPGGVLASGMTSYSIYLSSRWELRSARTSMAINAGSPTVYMCMPTPSARRHTPQAYIGMPEVACAALPKRPQESFPNWAPCIQFFLTGQTVHFHVILSLVCNL